MLKFLCFLTTEIVIVAGITQRRQSRIVMLSENWDYTKTAIANSKK